jgi:hypothetical protein
VSIPHASEASIHRAAVGLVALASLILLLAISSFAFLLYAGASDGCQRNNYNHFPRCFNEKD